MTREWLTVDDVVAELKVSHKTVYGLVRRGRLDAAKIAKSFRIERAALDRYLVQATEDAKPKPIVLEPLPVAPRRSRGHRAPGDELDLPKASLYPTRRGWH